MGPISRHVRRLIVEVLPEESWANYGIRTRIRIDVRTDTSAYSLSEMLRNEDFPTQLHDVMARVEREIAIQCGGGEPPHWE
ncbi:MAG: hypothetical protein ACREV5_13365 [Steroidobacter sp.]